MSETIIIVIHIAGFVFIIRGLTFSSDIILQGLVLDGIIGITGGILGIMILGGGVTGTGGIMIPGGIIVISLFIRSAFIRGIIPGGIDLHML